MGNSWFLALNKTPSSIARHVCFWLGFYLLFTGIMSFIGNIKIYALINLVSVCLFIVAYYSLRYILIPKLYNTNRKGLFGLALLGLALLVYCLYWLLRINFLEHHMNFDWNAPFENLVEFALKTVRFFSPTMLLLVWENQYQRKQDLNRRRLLEKEKLATELKFLKAQINPHFLFNTLNNLYSFVVTKSPKAPEMLSRLTGILDYVINQSQHRTVPLSSEIDTIEHYLELEKIRYGDRLEVQYNTNSTHNNTISPLILLSIIENAFKHGVSGDIENPKVHIDIQSNDDGIYCKVWNTKSKYKGELNDEYKQGIGLSNIKRQLKLIYPEQHKLKIEDQEKSFTLSLRINTAA